MMPCMTLMARICLEDGSGLSLPVTPETAAVEAVTEAAVLAAAVVEHAVGVILQAPGRSTELLLKISLQEHLGR